MASLGQQLERWTERGVIDVAAAERIRAFEESQRQDSARPGLVEVVVYLAATIIAVGVLVLVATNWRDMGTPPRIALPGLAMAVTIAAGAVMRSSRLPGVRRGAQVAWLVGTGLTATTAAVVADESGAAAEWIAVAAAGMALPLALALWTASRTHVQVFALAGASALASMAVVSVVAEHGSEDYATFALGAMLAGFSSAAILAVELKMFGPALSTRILASLGIVVGVICLGVPPGPAWAEASGFIAGGSLIALSLRRGEFTYMAVAVLTIFVGLSTLILRHVDDTTMAALAFIAVGMVLLAGIILLERVRPWSRRGPRSQKPPDRTRRLHRA